MQEKTYRFLCRYVFSAFPILRCLFYRVNQLFQLLIGNGADVFLYELTVFEESEGRNAHDFKGSCQLRIEGYEIHMGETVRKEGTEAFTFIDDQNRADSDKLDGAQKGNVYGTYVHGIFDKEEVAERIVEALAKNMGIVMEQIHGVDYQTFKETQYDILADALREHLDMKKIYQILEEGA